MGEYTSITKKGREDFGSHPKHDVCVVVLSGEEIEVRYHKVHNVCNEPNNLQ